MNAASLAAEGSWLAGGFGHHTDLLREGDEARIFLVGAQERKGQWRMSDVNFLASPVSQRIDVNCVFRHI